MKGKHSEDYNNTSFDENEVPKAFRKNNNIENAGEKKEKMGKKQKKHKKLKIFGKVVLVLVIILAILLLFS